MNIYVTIYNTAMVASLLVSLGVALMIWRLRRFPGTWAMIALAIAVFVWTAGYFFESHSYTLDRQLFCISIGYLGSMAVPPSWFAFCLKYTSNDRLLTFKQAVVMSVIPFTAVVLVWTNQWHHLMWSNEHLVSDGPFIITVKDYGPAFWVMLGHNYVLMLGGMLLLVRYLFRGPSLYKWQTISLWVALVLPFAGNVIYNFDLIKFLPKDLTPVMFSFSGLALVLGLSRYKLFKVVPFAYKFIFREMQDGVVLFDCDGRLIEANRAAFQMTGTDSEIIGKQLSQLGALSPLFASMTLTEGGYREVSIGPSGSPVFYEMDSAPMTDNSGRDVGRFVSIHEITERKKAEQRLSEAYEKEQYLRRSLEAEVHKRARYTRALVHELKTPLTPIIATSDVMMAELKTEPWAQMAANINRGGYKLDRKIDQLLDLARSEIGTLKIEITDIFPVDVMRDAIQEMRAAAELRKQRLEVEIETPLPAIKADKTRLRQVICNLVDNAFKFSHDEGTITLRARHKGDKLVVEVEDNGPGLTEAEQSRLFQIYERTDTDRRRLSGLGLGLALSKSLIELHGGSIWVKSQKDCGSIFGFAVPVTGPENYRAGSAEMLPGI